MTQVKENTGIHPAESELAGYLDGTLSEAERESIQKHIATCDECLANLMAAHESVRIFKKRKAGIMKKINIYFSLAIVTFALSFILPRYFLQFLTATLLLGIKWVADSKSTKMLVMIYDAWKKGGEKEASRVLSTLDKEHKNRF